MKAVIMAGGRGSRLSPLTDRLPKPLTPVANTPALKHIIRLLKKAGVTQAVVTTMYLGEMIENLGEEFEGVRLEYIREQKPLGTAGSVKGATAGFDDDFIVISGDCICDFELEKAMEFHRAKKARCTVVLTEKSSPLEYGVALCRKDDSIWRFLEKPSWSQVFSSTVNTGIYIISPQVMELVPPDTNYDFGKDLFPKLVGKGMYGYTAKGYWCDVGSLNDYYRCNYQAAKGEIASIEPIELQNGCIIGENCHIEGKVQDCIIHQGVTVEKGAFAQGCILCRDVKIAKSSVVNPGAVIGAGCVIQENCVIGQGVKINADIEIKKGSIIMNNIMFQSENTPVLSEKGICGSIRGNLSPQRCFSLGAACVVKDQAKVGVMCCKDDNVAGLVKNCICGGISHGGGVVMDFHEGTKLLADHCGLCYRPDVMIYVETSGDDVCIQLMGENSLSLDRNTERKILSDFENGAKMGKNTYKTIDISGIRHLYTANLVKNRPDMSGFDCMISDTPEGQLLAESLNMLSAKVRLCSEAELQRAKKAGHFCFEVSQDNLKMHLGEEFTADFEHILAYNIHHKAPAYSNIALPYISPQVYKEIAEKRGARVLYYLSSPVSDSDKGARKVAGDVSQLIFREPCFAAMQICVSFCDMNYDRQNLIKVFREIPSFFSQVRDIDYDDSKRANVMKRICSNASDDVEGAKLIFKGGRAIVIPRRTGGFRIIAEATGVEAAREISFVAERRLYEDE